MDIDKSHLPETDLIRLSLEGDSKAFEVLFDHYKEMIRELLHKRTNNDFDTSDLMQETFIKAFLNLEKYNGRYTFAQWIHTIARNTFIDHIRRRNSGNNLLPIDENTSSHEVSRNSPEDIFIAKEKREEIEKNIHKLSPRYRRIIELRYYRELSYEEIALEMGIPTGTVKTNLHRAKENLNKIIKHE